MRPAVALCAFLILAIPLIGVPGTDTPSQRDIDIDIIPDGDKEASVAPTAVLIARPDEADVDEEVFLDATDSYPGSGTKMWFRFHFGDGTESTEWLSVGITSHPYSKKGTYKARVEVRNENDEVSETSVSIEVGQDDDALLFGLSAMSLMLIVVIAALVIGLLALALKRRRKAAEEPYYDPYAAKYASGGVGDDYAEEGYPEEEYPEEDLPEDEYPDEGPPEDDVPDEEVPEEPEDVAVAPPAPVPKARPARPPVKKKVKRPVKKAVKQPPAEPAMKSLMVNCPNCDNNMEIKYIGPPVFLTCDKCGMKGEIPEEMLD